MSPKKPLKQQVQCIRRKAPLFVPIPRGTQSLPPLFLTNKLRKTIGRLLPPEHHRRLRLYFEIYGCIRCSRNQVLYGGNGICMLCLHTIQKRLRKVDQRLHSTPPQLSPDWRGEYLRPYDAARQLLADLVPKINKQTRKRVAERKRLSLVYMKWLATSGKREMQKTGAFSLEHA